MSEAIVDVKAVAAQRRGEAAGVVDRLGQRRGGIGIMTIADHEGDAGSLLHRLAALFGRDRLGGILGGIGPTLVQRGMGADRQRDQADQRDANGQRAAGDAVLPYIHHVQFPIVDQGAPVSRASAG